MSHGPDALRRRLDLVLLSTSFAAGTVDVASFAKLGGVLASAMTGNLALLGLYLGQGSAAAVGSAVALLAFFAGASIGAWAVRPRLQETALKFLLAAELVLLLAGAICWLLAGEPHSGLRADGVIALLALAMGLQIIAARQLNLAGIPTVVFTSTLANLAMGITERLTRHKAPLSGDALRQGTAVSLYLGGAVTAGLCSTAGTAAALFLPAGAVGFALAALLWP